MGRTKMWNRNRALSIPFPPACDMGVRQWCDLIACVHEVTNAVWPLTRPDRTPQVRLGPTVKCQRLLDRIVNCYTHLLNHNNTLLLL